jgi:hypothetical protein
MRGVLYDTLVFVPFILHVLERDPERVFSAGCVVYDITADKMDRVFE